MGYGGDGAEAARKQQQAQEAQVNKAVGSINKNFAGFDDKFFQNRTRAYEMFAMPQLGEQFRQTKHQADYKLAGAGMLKSTAGRGIMDSLMKNYATQQQGVVDAGQQQSNQLRQDVQNSKSNLITQAQNAAFPSSVAQNAIGTAAGFSAPSTFAPIGNMMGNWANIYLASKQTQAMAPYMNYWQSRGSSASLPNQPVTTQGGY